MYSHIKRSVELQYSRFRGTGIPTLQTKHTNHAHTGRLRIILVEFFEKCQFSETSLIANANLYLCNYRFSYIFLILV